MYVSPNRFGIWESSWIVPICHERSSTSMHVEVDLRTVERPFALSDEVLDLRGARAPTAELPSVKSHSSSVPSFESGPRRELEARLDPEEVVDERR